MADISLAVGQAARLAAPGDEAHLRSTSILVYLLLSGLVTAVPAVLLAYATRGQALETAYESHFSNAIELFWVVVVVGMTAAPLIYLFGLGLAIEAVLLAWLVFRIVKGLGCAYAARPCERS
jgi:uncharacterized membrane protein